jgi:hypothetical protein
VTARILDCTLAQYFADPCSVPSLSQSIAHVLVSQSPLHAWQAHPRLGGGLREESTAAADDGAVVHKLLLGAGANVEILGYENYRTKVAQERRDAALAEGRLPMLARKYEQLQRAADAIKANLAGLGVSMQDGVSEVMVEWQETGLRGPITCRGMIDRLFLQSGRLFDIKKIRSAHPRTCQRHMIEYGYDIQHAAYTSAVAKLMPELEGRIEMLFLFVEVEPPYSVLPARPDGSLRELGAMKWSRALHTWEQCLINNRWPGYADSVVSLPAPAWALTEEMGASYAE